MGGWMDGWMDGWVDGLLSMCHMLTDSNSAANSKIEKRPCGSLCGSAGCSMRIIHPHDAGTSRRQRTVEPTPNHTQKRREGRTLLERAAEKQGLFVPPLLQQCCSARCACCLSLHLHLRHRHHRRTQPPPTRACSVFFANDPAGKRLSHTDTHALAVRVDEAQARSKGDAARARTSCTCSISRRRSRRRRHRRIRRRRSYCILCATPTPPLPTPLHLASHLLDDHVADDGL